MTGGGHRHRRGVLPRARRRGLPRRRALPEQRGQAGSSPRSSRRASRCAPTSRSRARSTRSSPSSRRRAGRLDVLVNNAGLNGNGLTPAMKLERLRPRRRDGARHLVPDEARAAAASCCARTAARIVNITSVVGHTGNPGQVPYTMVKAALDAFTKSLAQELAGRAILVNSVAPGFIDTDMTAELPGGGRARRSWRASRSGAWARRRRSPRSSPGSRRARATCTARVIHVNGGMYGG